MRFEKPSTLSHRDPRFSPPEVPFTDKSRSAENIGHEKNIHDPWEDIDARIDQGLPAVAESPKVLEAQEADLQQDDGPQNWEHLADQDTYYIDVESVAHVKNEESEKAEDEEKFLNKLHKQDSERKKEVANNLAERKFLAGLESVKKKNIRQMFEN